MYNTNTAFSYYVYSVFLFSTSFQCLTWHARINSTSEVSILQGFLHCVHCELCNMTRGGIFTTYALQFSTHKHLSSPSTFLSTNFILYVNRQGNRTLTTMSKTCLNLRIRTEPVTGRSRFSGSEICIRSSRNRFGFMKTVGLFIGTMSNEYRS